MPTVLLAGFEPFGGDPANPSGDAVTRLVERGLGIADVALHPVVLPCVFGRSVEVLTAAIDATQPDLVVAAGLAGGRIAITPERVAVNVDDARIADNAGQTPVDAPVVPGGPAAYYTGLPVKRCVARLRAAGVPALVSQTAGTFVCNHVFYALMHLAATTRPGLRAGFVHVPWAHEQALDGSVPSLAPDTIVIGLREIVLASLSDEPDLVETGGAVS